MVHQEDAGLNAEMAKLAFSKGIWSYVCKMDHALRQYTAAKYLQSSLGVTAVTLIQKVIAISFDLSVYHELMAYFCYKNRINKAASQELIF